MQSPGFRPRVTIGGVPVHAMLVGFPVSCFVGALMADFAYSQSPQVQWANFAQWLLAFGEIFGVAAALFGLLDLFMNPRGSRPTIAWWHWAGSVTTLVLGLFNNFVHARDGYTGVVPVGLTLSILTVLTVVLTGLLGLRMAHIHQMPAATRVIL